MRELKRRPTSSSLRARLRFGLLLVLFIVVIAGCTTKQPNASSKLTSATLRREVILKNGDPLWQTIHIDDAATLAKLESFFPGYRQRPISKGAGGWMQGYQVEFNFSDSAPVRVIVEAKPTVESWSVGQGDHPIQGDFKTFADAL